MKRLLALLLPLALLLTGCVPGLDKLLPTGGTSFPTETKPTQTEAKVSYSVVDALVYEKDVIPVDDVIGFWDPTGWKHSLRIPMVTGGTPGTEALNQKIMEGSRNVYDLLVSDAEDNNIFMIDYDHRIYQNTVAIILWCDWGVQAGGIDGSYEAYYFDTEADCELTFSEYLDVLGTTPDEVTAVLTASAEFAETSSWLPTSENTVVDCILDENGMVACINNNSTMNGWFSIETGSTPLK